MSEGDEIAVNVSSIFGQKADQGLVNLEIGEMQISLTPTKAREIAGFLWECAESAESDELFLRFFRDRLGVTREQVGMILHDFRRQREEFRVRAQSGEGSQGNER